MYEAHNGVVFSGTEITFKVANPADGELRLAAVPNIVSNTFLDWQFVPTAGTRSITHGLS